MLFMSIHSCSMFVYVIIHHVITTYSTTSVSPSWPSRCPAGAKYLAAPGPAASVAGVLAPFLAAWPELLRGYSWCSWWYRAAASWQKKRRGSIFKKAYYGASMINIYINTILILYTVRGAFTEREYQMFGHSWVFEDVPQTVWPHWGVLTVTVKGRCSIEVVSEASSIFPLNFRAKCLLWHVHVRFDCAARTKCWPRD